MLKINSFIVVSECSVMHLYFAVVISAVQFLQCLLFYTSGFPKLCLKSKILLLLLLQYFDFLFNLPIKIASYFRLGIVGTSN